MKVLNFMILVFFATMTTFLHTNQRIEAVRYSYEIKTRSVEVNKLLDHKEELEYNVSRLKAPRYLEFQLAKSDVKMVLPERWQVFETADIVEEREPVYAFPKIVRNVVGFFSLKSEAQATPAVR